MANHFRIECVFHRMRIFFLFFLSVGLLFGQSADSLKTDFVETVNPNTATIRSILVPGWGQWTNGSPWKTTLAFYGELALAGGAIHFNQLAVGTQDHALQESYRDQRRMCLFWLAAAHCLNIMDAMAEAHMKISARHRRYNTGTDEPSTPRLPSINSLLFRSVLLPGWGQWTNGSVWKTALIFYGELTLAGSAVHFNQLAVDSKDDYMREYYKENRRLYLWWLAAAHLLGILDALVDAHLKDFDVSPDLTIHVQEDKPVCMMGLKLSLSKRSADPHCRE